MGDKLQVPITKAGGFIEVDTDDVKDGGDLTAEVYREALMQGLKVILNRGMSKTTKESFTKNGVVDEAGMKAAAMKIAVDTFKKMRDNSIRFTGTKAKKEITGEVMTEAMRVARGYVKQFLKDEGKKISHVDPKEITKAAKALLEENPELVQEAKATVEARKSAKEVGIKGKAINVAAIAASVSVDPKKVAKAEAEKAERAAASSAAKAGKTAKRPLKTKPAHAQA